MHDAGQPLTVIVRAHNDEKLIARTLDMLSSQKRNGPVEIICVDDHSTDATAQIAGTFPGVRVLRDPPTPYVPGKTLNYALRQASGEIIVFNNSDAIPLSQDYLETLIAPLSDRKVAAVFGNQICRPDATPLVRKDYERAFGDGSISASWRHFFSLASSAMRKETLLKHPFDETLQYSEDTAWSWERKKEGLRIVYVPEARVEHSHNYTHKELWKRFYMEGYFDVRIYGAGLSFPSACRQYLMESMRDLVYLLRHGEFAAITSVPVYRFLQKFAEYKGGRDSEYERKRA